MEELWMQSNIYPNYYVSNTGRVKHFHAGHNRWEVKSQRSDKDGYKTVGVSIGNGRVTTARVHRLVADAFIPNPNNNPIVHHKDNVSDNNDASNLEWTDISFNTKHSYHIGKLVSPGIKRLKVTVDGELYSYYHSVKECGKAFDVSTSYITASVKDPSRLIRGVAKVEVVDEIPETDIVNRLFIPRGIIDSMINPFKIGGVVYATIREYSIANDVDYSTAQRYLHSRNTSVEWLCPIDFYRHFDFVDL